MKKLLILMLVLGLASFANATLYISVNGETTATDITLCNTGIGPGQPYTNMVVIDIYNTNNDGVVLRNFWTYLDIEVPSQGGYSLANAAKGAAAGDMSTDFGFTVFPNGGWVMGLDYAEEAFQQAWNPASVELAGQLWHVDLTCTQPGKTVYLTLFDSRVAGGMQAVDSLVIHQVPEPTTMLLLGLGGLLLRRRK